MRASRRGEVGAGTLRASSACCATRHEKALSPRLPSRRRSFIDRDLEAYFGRLGEHQGCRAILFLRELHRALDLGAVESCANHSIFEMDAGKHLGIIRGAFGVGFDDAIGYGLPRFPEYPDDIERGARGRAR